MPEIVIKLDENKFQSLVINGAFINTPYEIKEVVISDDLFKDDSIYQDLKKASVKAYKDLKIYEFNKRHNIKH